MPDTPHIDTERLRELSREAVIADDEEVRHLRNCEECQEELRSFVKERQAARTDSTSQESTKKSA